MQFLVKAYYSVCFHGNDIVTPAESRATSSTLSVPRGVASMGVAFKPWKSPFELVLLHVRVLEGWVGVGEHFQHIIRGFMTSATLVPRIARNVFLLL